MNVIIIVAICVSGAVGIYNMLYLVHKNHYGDFDFWDDWDDIL